MLASCNRCANLMYYLVKFAYILVCASGVQPEDIISIAFACQVNPQSPTPAQIALNPVSSSGPSPKTYGKSTTPSSIQFSGSNTSLFHSPPNPKSALGVGARLMPVEVGGTSMESKVFEKGLIGAISGAREAAAEVAVVPTVEAVFESGFVGFFRAAAILC